MPSDAARSELTAIPNVGPAIARKLRALDVASAPIRSPATEPSSPVLTGLAAVSRCHALVRVASVIMYAYCTSLTTSVSGL